MRMRRAVHSAAPSMWSTKQQISRLPLPPLAQSLAGYVEAVTPLVSPSALCATQSAVADFLSGEGRLLHEELTRLDGESPTSWIEGFWDAMYLEARSSVAVDWNPSFVLRAQLPAARWVRRALEVQQAIAAETFPPDFEGSTPLHMRQHGRLFGCARVPQPGRDILVGPSRASHIAVLAKGHAFRVPVLTAAGGTPLPEEVIAQQLAKVRQAAESMKTGPYLGALTALDRDDWAALRSLLLQQPDTRRAVNMIDEALFVACLDGLEPSNLTAAARQMLIGHQCERWFDKWCLIFTPSGKAGFNLEHSPFDGHTFVSMFNHMATQPPASGASASARAEPIVCETADIALPPPVKQGIARGLAYLKSKNDQLALACLDVNWGTDVVKTLKSSPDAFMQLSFQLAFVRRNGRVGVTYESGNVKRFLAGRTETIRPVTVESAEFALNWDRAEGAEKRRLYDRAAAKHVQRVTAAKSGNGWDRHLFALRNLARHKQQRLPNDAFRWPSLFSDPTFAKYFNIEVSTSNSGALPFEVFSFAPVIAEGIGIGYQTFPQSLSVCTTSYEANAAATSRAAQFSDDLAEAFASLRKHLAAQ